MKLFILGLLVIIIIAFFAYKEKIRESYVNIHAEAKAQQEYTSTEREISDILNEFPIGAALVPKAADSTTDFIKVKDESKFLKTNVAKFEKDSIDMAIPKGDLDESVVGCRAVTKCSQLNNGDCGYCVYTNEFKYGGKTGPKTDVCPENAWTNNPDECQMMREEAVCKKVKNCGDLIGEAAELCGWCPTAGRAMPFKVVNGKKVPKYPKDVCNDKGYGLLGAKECEKFLKDHPCLTPTAFSGPHSAQCLSKLWKDGGCTRKVDWIDYAKNKNNWYQKRGMDAILADVKAWKKYTISPNYATAVKGSLNCFGSKPDPCDNQFKPTPPECLDELWKKGGGKKTGTGLPSKAGSYSAGQSTYKRTIGGYDYTLAEAEEKCAKDGARLCQKYEIMDKDICSAGWTADGIRGYPMANGIKFYDTKNANPSTRYQRGYCGGRSNGWRTWSTNPNNKGSAHCCYIWNKNAPKKSIVEETKKLADLALNGDAEAQGGYMKMVFGENWTPPPPPKVGDTVELKWKEGKINSKHTGIVIQKLGNKCSIMWTDYKGKWTLNRYNLKNNASDMKSQRYWFGWPGIKPEVNLGPNVDAGGLVLDNHLKVIKRCSNAPSACALNCKKIIQHVLERFPPPQDCVMNNWNSWAECSKECGEGTQSRSRTVKYPAKHGGKSCPPATESRTCQNHPCYPKNYKGCYKDCKGRDLPTLAGNLTKAQCAEEARKVNSKYYGLQYQNGVGGGSRDLAQCWLGSTYGKQGKYNNCKNLGAKGNIPYGQSCANAVYENENYDPNAKIYIAQGNRYCKTYDSYKRYFAKDGVKDIFDCQKKCRDDPACNALAFSPPGARSDKFANSCVTYHNCQMTDQRQSWGFNYWTPATDGGYVPPNFGHLKGSSVTGNYVPVHAIAKYNATSWIAASTSNDKYFIKMTLFDKNGKNIDYTARYVKFPAGRIISSEPKYIKGLYDRGKKNDNNYQFVKDSGFDLGIIMKKMPGGDGWIGVDGRSGMGACEADCDGGQCGSGLKCLGSNKYGPPYPYGCVGNLQKQDGGGMDYCVVSSYISQQPDYL